MKFYLLIPTYNTHWVLEHGVVKLHKTGCQFGTQLLIDEMFDKLTK